MQSQRLPIIVGDEIIFDVLGADSAGDNDADDSEEELDSEELEDENPGDEDEDDSDDEDEGDSVESLREQLAEANRLRSKAEFRMRAADRAKTAAEAKLNKATTGDKATAELAKANETIETLRQQLAEAGGQDTATLVREEFRDLADYSWHNNKIAFSMLDLGTIEVVDGKVDPESLKYAAEELAKDHPYLLKTQGDNKPESKGDKPEEKREPRNPTGINPRRRKKSTDRAALKKKYPSLRSRD